MSGILWKLPLVLLVALLVAATTLATRARTQSNPPAPLAAALRPPPDGLLKAKKAAQRAAEIEALDAAIREFNASEGRPPADLAELARSHYLDYALTKPDLRLFRYDPATMSVTRIAR